MQINKSNNTSFKALYLPKSEQIAKFAQGDWFSTIKPELENLAKDVDLYIKLPDPDVLSCREKLRCIMINPKYDNFLTKMKEALLKSNPKTGEVYKVYFSSVR